MSIEAQIMDEIASRLSNVPEIVTVNKDRIVLSTSDFREHELPAAQVWDIAQTMAHQKQCIEVNWSMSIEIVMKSTETGLANQAELWGLRRKVELALFQDPNLGIPKVIHLQYTGNVTDLHLVEPYYIARIDFDVKFMENLTGTL